MKKLNKDERGIGHLALVLLIVIVVGVLGFVGWRVISQDKAKNETVKSATGDADRDCLEVYNDKVLCGFATNNANFRKLSYTAVNNSADSMGQTTQITVQNNGSGSSSIASKAGNSQFNSIVIGPTTYVQNNGSPWVKYDHDAPAAPSPANNLKFTFSSPDTSKDQRVNYKKIGQERCGGANCYKYQVSSPTISGTTYIWINPNDDYLMRLTTKSSDGTNDISVTYGTVTITAPSPTITPAEASDATYESWMQNAQQNSQ